MKERKESEDKSVLNLADAQCVACGEKYDTPHMKDCIRRRQSTTQSGDLRVLVKYEDVSKEVFP